MFESHGHVNLLGVAVRKCTHPTSGLGADRTHNREDRWTQPDSVRLATFRFAKIGLLVQPDDGVAFKVSQREVMRVAMAVQL